MTKKIIIANWKTYNSLFQMQNWCDSFPFDMDSGNDVVICPPYPFLIPLNVYLKEYSSSSIFLGAQNLSDTSAGAHTGEVPASLLFECGCDYILLCHSEVREREGSFTDRILQKVEFIKQHNMKPIYCVGETKEQRLAGTHRLAIREQLSFIVPHLPAGSVIAYEPVWAIGATVTPSVEEIAHIHMFIVSSIEALGERKGIRVVYGGNLNPDNMGEIFSIEGVDGGLIGRASLDASCFEKICRYGN